MHVNFYNKSIPPNSRWTLIHENQEQIDNYQFKIINAFNLFTN